MLPRVDAGADGAVLRVRVQPRASRDAVVGVHGEALKVAVTSPPVEGAANKAVIELLARACDVPKSSLRILRGDTGRDKAVAFTSLDAEELRARLRALLGE
jgi:uncharacterized protein (TIGR00251 family)